MRYIAHPNPDTILYTQIILAYANLVSICFSEPEKALDLWTEMTVDHKIPPTAQAYNAVILACARSGTKIYVDEAFQLASQMLDSRRDATGISVFRPDERTFCALLEGDQEDRGFWADEMDISGDDERRKEGGDPNKVDAEIDDEVLVHIFNTYAAYTPPHLRTSTLAVADQSKITDTGDISEATTEVTSALKICWD